MRRQTTLRVYYIVTQEATKHDAELETFTHDLDRQVAAFVVFMI